MSYENVHYKDILERCKEYHRGDNGPKYDKAYSDYLSIDKDGDKWDDHEMLDLAEAGKLIAFLNQWRTPLPARLIDFLQVLKETVPALNLMKDKTILDVDLSSNALPVVSIDQANIMLCFDRLANCGDGYLSTATSKVLHTINPELFVMWDRPIRKNLPRVSDKGIGREYALIFLPQMQKLAEEVISQVKEHEENTSSDEKAAKSFTNHCKNENSLAKIIDEYNFVISR